MSGTISSLSTYTILGISSLTKNGKARKLAYSYRETLNKRFVTWRNMPAKQLKKDEVPCVIYLVLQ